MVEPPRDWSPTKRSRPLSFALPSSPSSSTFSFNSRPLSPDLNNASTGARTRPSHRSTASLSSLAQLNLNSSSSSTSAHSPVVRSPNSLERSPSLHWGTFSTPQQSTAMSNSAASASSNGVGKEFEHVQNKTFAKWLNARLEPHGYPIVQDLGQDFSDGTRLIQLVEVLTEQSLGRYNQAPVLRVQKMENTKLALDRIKEIGVHLTNIGPEDIVDGNRKLILGMIWSLVLRFSIADINEEGSHAKDGLLLWCQRKTNGYDRVDVKDFTKSWVDGLAFCALIHRHRPDLLDYSKLATKEPSMPNSIENLELAFSIAERHLGIPRLLDVEDVCGTTRTYNGKPDERSLMTYVAQFFHAFSSKAQQETEARVISNFVEHMSELMLSVHDYERRLTLLLSSISAHLETLSALPSPEQTPYGTLLTLISSFTCSSRYLSTRSSWASERLELHLLLFRIGEKLKTYGLRAYEPPEGLRLIDLDDKWDSFQERERAHVGRFKRQVEKLRRAAEEHVKRLTESIERGLNEFELEVVTPKRGTTTSSRTGVSLETQLDHLQHVVSSSDRIVRLRRQLDELDQAEAQCIAYDIPVPLLPLSSASPLSIAENETQETSTSKSSERRSRVDTIHSASGLRNEFEQLEKQLTNKISFIENQIVARRTTSLKPEQLEEFESAFRAFDKEGTNRLGLDELVGALGSLGVAEINLEEIQQDEEDQVSFEEFIRFLSARAEDRLTGEKVRSCFRSVASEKGYVTELDLTRLELPTKSLRFLKEHMPQSRIEVPETTTAGVGGRADDVQTSTREEVVLDWEGFLSQFLE